MNENELDFQGIPPGMGKLGAMEIFSAADNQVTPRLKWHYVFILTYTYPDHVFIPNTLVLTS